MRIRQRRVGVRVLEGLGCASAALKALKERLYCAARQSCYTERNLTWAGSRTALEYGWAHMHDVSSSIPSRMMGKGIGETTARLGTP